MSKFRYKTKGNEPPQGKPNVYFACHPKDIPLYYEKYAKIIYNIQDCAVWVETEYEAPYDKAELELQLSQMQLIVIPVTTRLLLHPNRAVQAEFPFAQGKHIPVLPIMVEGSLEELYEEQFGNLKFIDPNDRDATRLGADKKFESYIKAVLSGSELAKEVRDAFVSYIFLSYRRADRIHAQKLMRMIHRNKQFEDVAIWYDEYLTPGEDFNENIYEILINSDLFVLTVTPNLVKKANNYVMETEYPNALGFGKAILPVEMEKTDRKALEMYYEKLPKCVEGFM